MTAMPNIFISYRRDDSPASARLIHERLREWFGDGHSFMDVEQIELGDDWKHVLDQRVNRCDALLTVIGPRWLRAEGRDGRRRLDDPDDFVRWEIREALARGKRVIPVLVDGAPLPRAADLPQDLAALATLQAQTITHATFDKDIETLVEAVSGERRDLGLAERFVRLTRMGKAAIAIRAAVIVVTISLAWANIFDLLGLDTRTASFTMLLGDVLFEVPLSRLGMPRTSKASRPVPVHKGSRGKGEPAAGGLDASSPLSGRILTWRLGRRRIAPVVKSRR